MTDLSQPIYGEIVEDAAEFFAPVSADLVDGLVGRYDYMRAKIENLHEIIIGEGYGGAVDWFIQGNNQDGGRHGISSFSRLFDLPPAVAALNASFWSQALSLTDVYDAMPQKRRNEWNEQIREHKAPDFEDATVRATLSDLLAARAKFFAERVDGIFRALSGDHVTNSPSAFGKRMIVARMINSYDSIDYDRSGYLNDLRNIIAKFMGREESAHGSTGPLLEILRRNTGVWHEIDGGSFRMKMFKVGTCHIEVHPDMAWRLNAVLASIYPQAIPASFRTKPKARAKTYKMIGRPLPFAVVNMLAEMRAEPFTPQHRDRWSEPTKPLTDCRHALQFGYGNRPKIVQDEAERVLTMIGGIRRNKNAHVWFEFEFSARDAINEIVTSGCIPDQKSHQFYPTPANVAAKVIEMADIQPGALCLEPSAGTGGLADYMPSITTHCVEISAMHCAVLKSKGFVTTQADFIEWADTSLIRFDNICMNPPFSEGRWLAHLKSAASLLLDTGRITSVLPASAKGKDLLPGFDHEWSSIIDNQFAGTSVSVVILNATKSSLA